VLGEGCCVPRCPPPVRRAQRAHVPQRAHNWGLGVYDRGRWVFDVVVGVSSFQILVFGFRFPIQGFWVLGFGFWVLGFGFWVLVLGYGG